MTKSRRPSSSLLSSLTLILLFSRLWFLSQGNSWLLEGHSPLSPPHRLLIPPRLGVVNSPTPDMDVISLSQHHAQIARVLRSFMPSTCRFLSSGDVKLVSVHPVAAGGFADIWEATHDGRKVALKSYRCYMIFDVAQIVEVRCNHSLR